MVVAGGPSFFSRSSFAVRLHAARAADIVGDSRNAVESKAAVKCRRTPAVTAVACFPLEPP